MKSSGHGTAIVRSEYLIDRFHVVFERGGGWQCVCPDFLTSNACRHTREAAGRRAAQSQIAQHVDGARSGLGGLRLFKPRAPPAPQAPPARVHGLRAELRR
jgi:hypothetical protein